ncbi:hypothetical protein R1flu_005772 [Riccia fluitans]|uniref:RNase H type-1 domain-containing protein n=1 Tax=Riccia fluitans TaxID=41844 RepID=A0ABD1YU53_9MARC
MVLGPGGKPANLLPEKNPQGSNCLGSSQGRVSLKLNRTCHTWNGETSVLRYTMIAQSQEWINKTEAKVILVTLRREKNSYSGRMDWANQDTSTQPLNRYETIVVNNFRLIDVENVQMEAMQWHWQSGHSRVEQWKATMKMRKAILRGEGGNLLPMNKKWSRTESPRKWAKRLTKIWKSDIPTREKMWIWKIVQHGLPTLERAQQWSHGDNHC